jgi:hypothetical protein
MSRRVEKVALIGAKGYERVTDELRVDCFTWQKINKISNIRDFDTIIINLLSLKDKKTREAVVWNEFCSLFRFSSTMDILLHGGAIIVLGDPHFSIETETGAIKKKEKVTKTTLPFLSWTGIEFFWDYEPGDTVLFENDYKHRHYEDFISKLKKWKYSLSNCKINKETLGQYFNLEYLSKKDWEINLDKDFFCYNRYNNALAFALFYQYLAHGYKKTEVIKTFGPFIFLPEIDAHEDETLLIVLRDICGIAAKLPEPEWLDQFVAPGQKAVDEKIGKIEGEIKNHVDKLQHAQEEREQCRRCLKLLYEREYELEPVVRDILRGFGAHVEDPSEPNKEDGWVSVKIGEKLYEGVLEIKSTRSDQFDESGRKQLLDWIDRGRTLREKNYKGIFIGNSAVDKPFKERPWAFSDSWSKAAELSGICAIKTEDLYIIHLLKAKSEIDTDQFWEDVFSTNGIMDMKKYLEMLVPKENNDQNE